MERRAIEVEGIVQGVGFRPFVFALAHRLNLTGFVRNQTGGVFIEAQGDGTALDAFIDALRTHPPPLARVRRIAWRPLVPRHEDGFHITHSRTAGPTDIFISPDVGVCDACLAELFDPADRRYRYPFLNCTHCGPRLTIIQGSPYDRQRTTMAGFAMCDACRAEYDDPGDRRFHAQPTACPACGPRLALLDERGDKVGCDDPLTACGEALRAGRIAAIKGLGGFHLACDARNAEAVATLRGRKHREQKPLAVMVHDLEAARRLCHVGEREAALLSEPARPIVLLPRRPDAEVAEQVAPGTSLLGLMLPYTPLHHLLMNDLRAPLVMTSGNRSDEPIAQDNDEAVERLAGVADVFLVHDRPIHVRCDDSVVRVVSDDVSPVRRSRGYAPLPIDLPAACDQPTLAVGGQLKNVFALGRGRQALLSQHMGDLDHFAALGAFERDVALYERLFELDLQVIVHDLHPDYASTQYARQRAEAAELRLVGVQHHHAHMAACMAEHGLAGPVIGVTFDGTGYGTDGTVWGGEFLVGDCAAFRRAAHLRPVAMPGGEQAVREPWRMAVAHLLDAGAPVERLMPALSRGTVRTVRRMIERRLNAPLTSSAGRLFDAVAALLGFSGRTAYEGQAAIEMEQMATGAASGGAYPFALHGPVVDTRPLIRAVAADVVRRVPPALIARRFHDSIAQLIAHVCDHLRRAGGPSDVVLSGGVMMNALLVERSAALLRRDGFRVYQHRVVPANDGGLCLGQLAVAAARAAGAAAHAPAVERQHAPQQAAQPVARSQA